MKNKTLTLEKEKFHKKYEKLLSYIVKALALTRAEYTIKHYRETLGYGYIRLHTKDIYIEIGSLDKFDEDRGQVMCRWVWNINTLDGGINKWVPVRAFHKPDMTMRIIYTLIEDKKTSLDVMKHRMMG